MNRSDIRALIAQGHLSEALEAMQQLAAGTRHENEVALLSSRLRSIEQDNRRGLLSAGEFDRSRNQITHALLELLNELPEGATAAISVTQPPAGGGGTGQGTPPAAPSGTGDGGTAPGGSSGTGDGGTSHKMSVWIGVGSLAAILAAVLFVPCPSSAQFFVFQVILALGAAGIGSILPGFLHLEFTGAKAGGALALVLLVLWQDPAGKIGNDRCKHLDALPLTVFVSGKNGQSTQSLRQ